MPNTYSIYKLPKASGEGHLNISTYAYSSITQGTWVITINSLYCNNFSYSNVPPANLDQINYSVSLAKGIYTAKFIVSRGTTRGILDLLLNGSSVGINDNYYSSSDRTHVFSINNILITRPGLLTLSIKANGKNPLSTGYALVLCGITLFRTS